MDSRMANRSKYKVCRGLNGHTVSSNPVSLPLSSASNDRLSDPAETSAILVRKEKVAKGRKLIREPDYPSKEVLDSVANLLAKHL